MPASGNIVLLCNLSQESQLLARRLVQDGLRLSLIVCEAPPVQVPYSPASRLMRALVGHRLMNMVGQALLHEEDRATLRWEEAMKERADRIAQPAYAAIVAGKGWPASVARVEVDSINEPAVVDRVRAAEPDLLAVLGTRLLREPLIGVPRRGAINAHTSLLPEYRGTRPEFWQCIRQDKDHIGVTFHLITPRVDEGDILRQIPAQVPWPCDPYRLRAENLLIILREYPAVIRDHMTGRAAPIPQGPTPMRAWRSADLTLPRRSELRRRLEALGITA
ncbi:MAG: formyltransferase family protein [Flavobacteriales bacterium]|nr:MAG: formyltransferase family protein [Flavobacteriales bacterium]